MKIEGEIHSCVEGLDIYGRRGDQITKKKMIQTYWMECIVAIAMYAIAWPFACSRNGDSWREAERDDTDGGQLSRLLGKSIGQCEWRILLGLGPILMIEVERDLTFDCQSMRDAISVRKEDRKLFYRHKFD